MKSNRLRTVDERQAPLPLKGPESSVRVEDITRQKSLSGALAIGAAAAGLDLEKEVHIPLGIDPGHWTRMRSGQAGIQWELFAAICDLYGNDAPVLWMLHQRGWDLHSIRKRETETEAALRLERENSARLQLKLDALTEALTGRAV